MSCIHAEEINGAIMCKKIHDTCLFGQPNEDKCESMYGIVFMESREEDNIDTAMLVDDSLEIRDEEGDYLNIEADDYYDNQPYYYS